MFKNAAQFDVLRSVAFGSITSSYVALGPVLPGYAVQLTFKNATNAVIYLSVDGVTDIIAIPSGWGEADDVRANAPEDTDYFYSEGTQFYIKYSGSAPTSGSFYMQVLLAIVGG
jgi:hypothetical protein